MKLKHIFLAVFIILNCFTYLAQAENLEQIYQTAKSKDPAILRSKAQYDLSKEKISEANASLLPQLGFGLNAGYTLASIDEQTNLNYGAGLYFNQSLYNGAYWEASNLTEKQATQFAAAHGYASQNLLFRTANSYFSVLRFSDALKSVSANKKAVKRQLEQTTQRYRVGIIAIIDVHEAQAEYDKTVADEIMAQNRLTNSFDTLNELTGSNTQKIDDLNIATFKAKKPQEGVKFWRNKALEHNLLLHEKRISKEISKMQIELAQTGHSPTLDLTASLGYDNRDYDIDLPFSRDIDMSTANVGLSLYVPIYGGGRVNSQVKQAEFNYVMASEDLIATFRSTEASVNSSYNSVNASVSSIKAYEQTVKSTKSALKATQAGFEVGTRTIVDVLNATRSLYASQSQLSSARYDYIISMLQLKLFSGTLEESDIQSISAGLIKK